MNAIPRMFRAVLVLPCLGLAACATTQDVEQQSSAGDVEHLERRLRSVGLLD